jgi:thiosulfate/3-mercaptopyruvate sulfurtransferase
MYNTLLSTEDLAANIGRPDWRIIDCRFSLADTEAGRSAYAEGHIPGALYAHLDEDLSGPIIPGKTGRHPLPDMDKLIGLFSRWGIEKSTQVVAYDDKSGMAASRLWWLLRYLGHEQVAVLDGGFAAWSAHPGALVTNEPTAPPTPSPFEVRAHLCGVADALQVEHLREDAAFVLVDSREPYRYRGESEPIDAVAGHIPGAVNAFFMDNLTSEDGRFLSSEQLRERFNLVLDGRPAQQAVFYCGSGVSACHNILAVAHAGLGSATLYPGSWSEWITDPNRATSSF